MKTFYQLRNEDGLFLSVITSQRISFGRSGNIYRTLKSAETDMNWYYLSSIDYHHSLTIVSYAANDTVVVADKPDFAHARQFLTENDVHYTSGSKRGILYTFVVDMTVKNKSFDYLLLVSGKQKIGKNNSIVGKSHGDFGYTISTIFALNETDLIYLKMQFSDKIIAVWDYKNCKKIG